MELKLVLVCYAVTCCLVSCVASQDDFNVTVQPESTTAIATISDFFVCEYNISSNAQQIKVQWYKYTGDQTSPDLLLTAETNLDGTNSSTQPGPGYDEERLLIYHLLLPYILRGHVLVFHHLRLEDAGQYYCEVTYKDANDEFQSGQSPLARMDVIVRPVPFVKVYANDEDGNATSDIYEGDRGYADCYSSTKLPPHDEVTFTMNNGTQSIQCSKQTDPDVCRAQITFGCHDHNARWGCTATWNGTSYYAFRTVLDVKCDPVIDGYTGPLHEGDDLTLACTTENNPDAHIIWTFSANGESPREVAEGPAHTKQGVEMSDAGDYTCSVGKDGHTKNVTITVEVLERETTTAPMTKTDNGNETSGVSSPMMKDVCWKVWCCFVSLWLGALIQL